MNAALLPYLASDRLLSLWLGQTLSDRTSGAALFADISGFTPLTEQLTHTLGARRGIEELTRRINTVYEALIGSVEEYGGSVISFAGDAITCWFDDAQGTPAIRSAAAAQAMQVAMAMFEGLALKVAVTSGPARRFIVGDPTIQYLDALAGATVARLATAEHLANRGEILLDAATVGVLGEALRVKAWRTAEDGERFAVLEALSSVINPIVPERRTVEVADETLRPWLLGAVYEREQSGYGAFLTELRPAVALFVRFSGIDYDGDEQAGNKLDAVIRRAQQLVNAVDGTLLQLTIGDKGSYFYVSFGAPVAHEDDVRRAVRAALALRQLPDQFPFLRLVQIGLSSGTMRTGAYGGYTRLTYGVLGDEVNLAARLMTSASPGEILASGRVQKAVAERFTFEPRPPLVVKGKAEPQTVFAVSGVRHQRAIRLEEPSYALPMLGRQTELALIGEKLKLASGGHGQVIGITAEAGMGKSRLVAEVIRTAHQLGFTGYGGACESSGTNSAYLVWKPIWQAFFDVEPNAPVDRQVRHLRGEIEGRAPQRLQALPLLASMLDVSLDDNDFTNTLEPKDRRNALEALLEDCLKAAAQEQSVLFVLEDVHWIDPLSHDLLDSLARATANAAVCFVLAYRPPETTHGQIPRFESLPSFTRVALNKLTGAEVEQLISAKLVQWLPKRGGGLPEALLTQVSARAEGNPFYVEELLNYLRDRGINPDDAAALSTLEVPNNLHALILSRIDQLTETKKATLKVASIIGRLFQVAWLYGYYPLVGTLERVKTDLDDLARLDLTPLDTPEPELAYLFKHIVTQEVAYESLAYATRTLLHEQLAQFIEGLGADKYVDLLAFHFGRSENITKQREYFRKAGDVAATVFANEAALDYYARLLPLLAEPVEQTDLHLRWGAVLELQGRWEEAERHYQDALAQAVQDPTCSARCQLALGKLCDLRGNYPAALTWLTQAQAGWEVRHDRAGLGQTLIEIGIVYHHQGEFALAREQMQAGLALARDAEDKVRVALALKNLGVVAGYQSDFATEQDLIEQAVEIEREIGDKPGIGDSLYNLAHATTTQGDVTTARTLFEASLALRREIGDKKGIGDSLNGLGFLTLAQLDYTAARKFYNQGLAVRREIGDKSGIASSLGGLAKAAWYQGDFTTAKPLLEEFLALEREIGDKRQLAYSFRMLGAVAVGQGDHVAAQAYYEQSLALRREIGHTTEIPMALIGLGDTAWLRGDYSTARALYEEALALFRDRGAEDGVAIMLGSLGSVALAQGDYKTARELLQKALTMCHKIEYLKDCVMTFLIYLAAVAVAQPGEAAKAAQLHGAAETLRLTLGMLLPYGERGIFERTDAAAKAALGEEAFNAAFVAGQHMSLDNAVQLALAEN